MTANNQAKQKKAYLLMFFVILFWSSVATAFKLALQTVSPPQLLLFSIFVAMLIFWLLLIKQKKVRLLKKIPGSELVKDLAIGLLNPFLFYMLLFHAYDLLPGQIAMPINFSWPVVLSLMAIVFQKQPLNKISLLSLLLGFAGVVIIATKGEWTEWQNFSLPGIVLILSSTIIWSLYWMLNSIRETDPIIRLAANFTSGFFALVIIFPIISTWQWPTIKAWGYLLYVGFFEMGFTYILWMRALELTETTAKISILIFIIPFLSLIFLHFILGEQIYFSTFAGLLLIIFAIMIPRMKQGMEKRDKG